MYHKFAASGEREESCKFAQVHVRNPLRKSESIFLLNGIFKSGILMPVNRIHSAIKRHFQLCARKQLFYCFFVKISVLSHLKYFSAAFSLLFYEHEIYCFSIFKKRTKCFFLPHV